MWQKRLLNSVEWPATWPVGAVEPVSRPAGAGMLHFLHAQEQNHHICPTKRDNGTTSCGPPQLSTRPPGTLFCESDALQGQNFHLYATKMPLALDLRWWMKPGGWKRRKGIGLARGTRASDTGWRMALASCQSQGPGGLATATAPALPRSPAWPRTSPQATGRGPRWAAGTGPFAPGPKRLPCPWQLTLRSRTGPPTGSSAAHLGRGATLLPLRGNTPCKGSNAYLTLFLHPRQLGSWATVGKAHPAQRPAVGSCTSWAHPPP